MRCTFAFLALWVIAGCADPTARQEATNRCAAVGISARDPDFLACTEAYRLETQQSGISSAYQNAVDMQPRRRRPVE
jgi:Tfp pilus assembly protein PilW